MWLCIHVYVCKFIHDELSKKNGYARTEPSFDRSHAHSDLCNIVFSYGENLMTWKCFEECTFKITRSSCSRTLCSPIRFIHSAKRISYFSHLSLLEIFWWGMLNVLAKTTKQISHKKTILAKNTLIHGLDLNFNQCSTPTELLWTTNPVNSHRARWRTASMWPLRLAEVCGFYACSIHAIVHLHIWELLT